MQQLNATVYLIAGAILIERIQKEWMKLCMNKYPYHIYMDVTEKLIFFWSFL